MPPKIIPEYDIQVTGAGVDAEKKTLEFLKLLPEGYYILQECKINSSASKRQSGSLEDRPDFIVVGPEIGVVILEIKDWNIYTNSFDYLDQHWVRKTDLNGSVEILKNPYGQADEYFHAVSQVLENPQSANRLWVSSFVVYPKLTRNEFENTFRGGPRDNPQRRFIFDSNKTMFGDDLMTYRNAPLKLLQRYVEADVKVHQRQVVIYTRQQVNATVINLIPPEMRVGGLPDNGDVEKELVLLDEKQQQWAFSEALTGKTYLSDVAGSGKTNVLLSRAIYWARRHMATGGCRILVATYSKALKIELERIFRDKIAGDQYYDYYNDIIHIYDIISLMEEIVEDGMGVNSFKIWRAQFLSSQLESEYDEMILPEKCIVLLVEDKKRFQKYDYLLIDEIQDFSTQFLDVTVSLLKDHKNIFVVGDIGQKLYERELDWGEFDIVKQRVEIQSRFLMYRSPKPVARLAWKFLISDRFIKHDLEEEEYKTEIKPKSPFTYKLVFIAESTEEELLQHISDDIRTRLYVTHRKQILCIGLEEQMLGRLHEALVTASIPVRWAKDPSATTGDYIVLANYLESKGLEREYVYILDADRLASKISSFASEEQRKETRGNRIKLFVALTRAMREARLYYIDPSHPFIRELLQIQSTL